MNIHNLADSASYSQQLDLEALRKLFHVDDWGQLSQDEFNARYISLCESFDLDFRSKPFEMIRFPDGRFGPYMPARTSFAVAAQRSVSTKYDRQVISRESVTTVMTATGVDAKTGEYRELTRSGTVSLRNRVGQDRANGIMHSETKASRRAILAWLGLGFLDESEARDIEGAERFTADDLANRLEDDDPATVSLGELIGFKVSAREKGWKRSEWIALLERYGWRHEGAIRRSMLSEVLAALESKELLDEIRNAPKG